MIVTDDTVAFDIETRSPVDLPSRGGCAYAASQYTRITVAVWIVDGVHVYWLPGIAARTPTFDAWAGQHFPADSVVHVGAALPDDLPFHRPWAAHNAFGFDALVWEARGLRPPVAWVDTAPLARAVGLPGGLDAIGRALFDSGKSPLRAIAEKTFDCTPETCEPENIALPAQICTAAYCAVDVVILDKLLGVLRAETPFTEADVLAADVAKNARGVRFDVPLANELLKLTARAKNDAIARIAEITGGVLATQKDLQSLAKIKTWMASVGVAPRSSLAKAAVAAFIDEVNESTEEEDESEESPAALRDVVEVLTLRQDAIRVTDGKIKAGLAGLDDDGRLRGLTVYHGAHTGRDAGRKIQVQNMPTPKPGIDPWALVEQFEGSGTITTDSPADAAGALIRLCLLPDPGEDMMTADYSQIEARMLAWLAGEHWLMELFANDGDPYIRMAESIMGPKESWPGAEAGYKKHPYRQKVGKVPILACGYQGGHKTVGVYCASMGFAMEDYGVKPADAVLAYRRSHPAIAGEYTGVNDRGRHVFRGGFWRDLQAAFLRTASTGRSTRVGRIAYSRRNGHVLCRLPSGRIMTYRNVEVGTKTVNFEGESWEAETATFVHPRYGRKSVYGGLLAENVTQAASRDVMKSAEVRLEAAGVKTLFTVHDEIVATGNDNDRFMAIVSTPPEWLTDFPLVAEGSASRRYAKSPQPGVSDVAWKNGRRIG